MALRTSPVMQQHRAAKNAYPDAIVFFRLGDFYEMFEEDAVLCAPLLDLTLTSRNKGKPDEVPMAGVPYHAAHGYIGKLLGLGYKIAICEQLADPSTVKGIVPRDVVRVLTPGTVTEGEHLPAHENAWLVGVDVAKDGVGVALFDVSTAELSAARFPDVASTLSALCRAAPREIVLGHAEANADDSSVTGALDGVLPRTPVRKDGALSAEEVSEILGELTADARDLTDAELRAAARALRYARACSPNRAFPVRRIARFSPAAELGIDPVAERHLELVRSLSGEKDTTLLSVVDRTCTSAGARLLRRRLLAPLLSVARIRRRLDAVELFVGEARLRASLREALAKVTDLERLAVRASLGEATPRDLGSLRDGLLAARDAVRVLEGVEDAIARETLDLGTEPVDVVQELADELARALVERPPAIPREGTVFRPGFDAELDEADALCRHGNERMTELEGRLRESTGVGTLKVRYTRVFGWYIEVSRTQAQKVPAEWRRKQTVASGERYTLPELDDLADKIAHAEERHRQRELGLLSALAEKARAAERRIGALSERLARWDVASALADVAHRYDYRRPEVDEGDVLELIEARHPVVERLAAAGRFVPNDVRLDVEGERLFVVTGPNMAGKSTLLRQVALAVVLAQMGSFVPAKRARIGVVDRVLSRVGASDNLARGESTFMVEMRETAEILKKATRRSLVILDEIGRGTSTFDGLAIAWAVAEYLDAAAQCRTLFATHYHELTALAESSGHVANVSVSAEEVDGDVVFLHRLVAGPASRSYGVAVAKLAGLPESVLSRARALLLALEAGTAKPESAPVGKARATTPQLDLFAPKVPEDPRVKEVADTVRAVEIDRMTPLDALSLLARLKARLE
ncbi:MAG TPA: DNA mismatch repair protein MutS [Polyangiaceae bacterium]|nr:DNA mismatch repair protein MutS [Polyangiaceae bacterium]